MIMTRLQRRIVFGLFIVILLNLAIVTKWCLQQINGAAYECGCSLQAFHRAAATGAELSAGRNRFRAHKNAEVEIDATLQSLATIDSRSSHRTARTLADVLPPSIVLPIDRNSLYWRFCMQMSDEALYSRAQPNDQLVQLLHSITESRLSSVAVVEKGTQLKFFVESEDGSKTVMKPMKTKRDYEASPDLFYFSEIDKHTAEIAAHHLDRILGWRRVPPCTGRVLNISSELEPFFDEAFQRTTYTSPAGNRCFHGTCKYYCDTAHSVCGDPWLVEASLCLLLPYDIFSRRLVRNPWRRSYSKRGLADWQKAENNATFCSDLISRDPTYSFSRSRRLLDLIDLHIFDFLIGNQDRHHFESFGDLENSAIIAIDNGRGFGRSFYDDMSILAPLYQCCQMRKSTFEKLKLLSSSAVTLGDLLERSLASDPLSKRGPLLNERHLQSVDRRVHLVLQVFYRDCLNARSLKLADALIDDL